MYIYAIRTGDVAQGRLMRIGQEGVRVPVGDITGLPANDYNQGTFGEGPFANTMFVRASSGANGAMFLVDVDSLTATRLSLSPAVPNVSDIVFKDGYVWGYYGEGALMYRIDPVTGDTASWSLADLSYQGSKIQKNPYGAQWVYGNGNIGISNNSTGRIYQISISDPGSDTPTFAIVGSTSGPSSSENDGTAYAGEPIDLRITKSTDPTFRPGPGGEIEYTLTVTNDSTERTSTGYYVDDPLPEALVDPVTTTPGCGIADHRLTCSGGPLAPGESAIVTVTATTAAGQTACVENTATVLGNEADGDLTNNSATARTCPGTFTVQKEASATSAVAGDTVTYTVTVTNTGYLDFTEEEPASFTDDLSGVLDDAALVGQPTVAPAGRGTASVDGDGVLAWSGPLARGETVTVTYQVQVAVADAGDDLLTNTVLPGGGGSCLDEDACSTVTPVARYQVVKEVSATEVRPGETVTYTVTVTNTGALDFTASHPASFTDDLSEVLDDATYNGDADNGAVYAAPELSWQGALPVGESVTVTYSVQIDDPITGDHRLLNSVVTPDSLANCPEGSADPACSTQVLAARFTVAKEASVGSTAPGGTVTYMVTVRNTGDIAFTAADPASFTDSLAGVLDDAELVGAPTASVGTVQAADGALIWSGPLGIGQSATITYSVVVHVDASGDGSLDNTVAAGAGGACDPDEVCSTQTPVARFTVAKSASVTAAEAGSEVTYTIRVVNTGEVAYTADAPATFSDDLSGVLDDAEYVSGSAGVVQQGNGLTWSGALPVGGSVDVTYIVRVKSPAPGDLLLRNTVVPGPSGSCGDTCTTETPVAAYRVVKSVDSRSIAAGDTVTYSIAVTNTGAVPFTVGSPASFTDDLSGVLGDATYNDDADNGATYAAPVLSWRGALDVGETITVTYSVTVDDPLVGEPQLRNTVVTPGSIANCPEGSADPQCTVEIPARLFTVSKSVEASAAPSVGGDELTYTVTVTNVGDVEFTEEQPASFTDDLSGVLDDADLVDGPTASTGAAGAADGTLTWSGALAPGVTATVTYTVRVHDAATGDDLLVNTVAPAPDGACATLTACTTTTPVARYTVAKTASVASGQAGDTVTYTVTVRSTGQAPYTAERPATFTDDLTDVLDDASFLAVHSDEGEARFDDPTLTWTGALPTGATVTVVYSVQVDTPVAGEHNLHNVVLADGPGGGCDQAGSCEVDTPLAALRVEKTSSVAAADPGDVVEYAVTVTNVGAVDFTGDFPASFSDDLSAVLDDATYNDDADSGAVYAAPVLSWSGSLPVGGEPVTVRYSVTVDDPVTGDQLMDNVVGTPTGLGNCADGSVDPVCRTSTPVRSFEVVKSVSVTEAGEGDRVVYTITVRNTGPVAFTEDVPASFTDDMADVLDDAGYNDDVTAGAVLDGALLSWSGVVPVGGAVEITYSVTVATPTASDRTLTNVVLPTGIGTCGAEGCVVITTVLEADPAVDPPVVDPPVVDPPVVDPPAEDAPPAADPPVVAGPAPTGSLAHTGADVVSFTLLGGLLLLVGAALTTWRRNQATGPTARHSR